MGFYSSLIIFLTFIAYGHTVLDDIDNLNNVNWLDAAPGVAMEYKVHVDAGKEDCYWQYVHEGATIFVSYQVLKGGDGAIGFAVRKPDGTIVHPYAWKANSEYEESSANAGYYSVCLDNQFSKFSAKLVNLYMTTFRYDEWEKFAQDLADMDSSVQNLTQVMTNVDKRVQVMRQFQQLSRGLESRDFNVIESNFSYVQTWSFVQCAVVIISGFVQVHFVKKLFGTDTRGAGGRSQTRA